MEKNFSYENALHFAKIANLAYQEEQDFKKTASAMGYKKIKYFDVDGAQAYGMCNKDCMVLAFRGTEPNQWNDIKAMRFVNFQRKDDIRQYGKDEAKVQLGLLSQELEKVSPNLVREVEPNTEDIIVLQSLVLCMKMVMIYLMGNLSVM